MRALWEKTGLTMEELADKTGVSIATLYSWENASRSPVNDDLLNVAKVLNVNVRNLLPKE
jgi:transcriptional regulator with XRE-family HTH domain